MTTALGWFGSALVVLSFTQRDVRRIRLVNLAAALVLVGFHTIVGIASMVALNVVLAAVNAYHLARPVAWRPRFRRTSHETLVVHP